MYVLDSGRTIGKGRNLKTGNIFLDNITKKTIKFRKSTDKQLKDKGKLIKALSRHSEPECPRGGRSRKPPERFQF